MTFLLGCILALAALIPAQGATSSSLGGVATWYIDPHKSGLYAAAGPDLRHGDWRGSFVTVTSGSRSVTVQLTDWCACGDRGGQPTLLDLSASAFRRLAPLSKGVIAVEVTTGARIELPRTDTVS